MNSIYRHLTSDEIIMEGLRTGQGPKLDVITTKKTGRGVVTRQKINKGDFVCEYKTSAVFPLSERDEHEERHKRNGLGCYIVDTQFCVPGVGRLCFDATERFHSYGRLINHVAKKPNIRLTRPFEVRGKMRIGFVALRDIPQGEELCYDYGDRSGEDWMKKGRLVKGRVVAAVEETSDEEREGEEKPRQQAPKKRPNRRSVYCPVPECTAPPLKKVSQHLRQFHKLGDTDVRRLLKNKRYTTREEIHERKRKKPIEKKSGNIQKMLGEETEKVKSKPKNAEKGKGRASSANEESRKRKGTSGTRDMQQHSGPFLDEFNAFLKSRDGGKKSDRNAKGITANVSKYLYWCDPDNLDGDHLTRTKQVKAYISEMEKKQLGASALQQKVYDIEAALRFLMARKEDTPEEAEFNTLACSAIKKLKDFRCSFQGEKIQKERESGKAQDREN